MTTEVKHGPHPTFEHQTTGVEYSLTLVGARRRVHVGRIISGDAVLCCLRPGSRAPRERRRATMIQRFDHVTVVVRDLERARRFFGLLGFAEDKAVVIKGPVMDAYMGVPGIEADHVTLVLRGVAPRLEVQLLRYRHPEPLADPNIERLEKVGFNHVCFVVDDIEAEVARLRAHGIAMRNELMDFHSRKLIFVKGPEGITVELSQWEEPRIAR